MARQRRADVVADERMLPRPEEDLRDQRHDRIAERAFEIYEGRGGEHGQDLDDWLQAEREVDAEIGLENRED